ncbi:hypothetical protein ACWF9O_35170, partial [Streptomyces sp. NPDC055085]
MLKSRLLLATATATAAVAIMAPGAHAVSIEAQPLAAANNDESISGESFSSDSADPKTESDSEDPKPELAEAHHSKPGGSGQGVSHGHHGESQEASSGGDED